MNILLLLLFVSSLYSGDAITKKKITDFGYNVFSQFGEDGIIEAIFNRIGTSSKVVVEFGANDGLSCSNSAFLWKQKGWTAILIESDQVFFEKCLQNTAGYDCVCIKAYVGYEPTNSLEYILNREGITEEIDLLSIDIDGNDYYILQSLQKIRPRVIICEYNASIPAELDLFFLPNNHIGCSVAALKRIGVSLGYTLIGITLGNCIFIRNDFNHYFHDIETELEKIKIDTFEKHIISSYKGEICMIGRTDKSPWGYQGKKYEINNIGRDGYSIINSLKIH